MRTLLTFLGLAAMVANAATVGLRSTTYVTLDGTPLCQNEGTIESLCTGSESRPNGSVSGSAAASSDFGTLAVFAQFTHSAFESTVVTEIGVAQALASFADRLSIASGPTTLMAFNFELEGQAIGPEFESYAAFRFNEAFLGQTQTTVHVQTPFIELRPGEPVDVLFELIAYAARQNSDFGTSRVEFDRTLRMTGIVATDLTGSPVAIELISESGTVYPTSAAAVPEPGTVWAVLGVAAIAAWRIGRDGQFGRALGRSSRTPRKYPL
jgi:hypothetical protein